VRFEAGGKSLTYSADSGVCDSLVEHARGSDLFLCEASYADGVDNPPGIHLTGGEAADHAKRAEVGRLVITHQVPWNDPAQTMERATAGFPGPVDEAHVCASYEV
jgi:ribonuclease BN (tRNA processing enzyme)